MLTSVGVALTAGVGGAAGATSTGAARGAAGVATDSPPLWPLLAGTALLARIFSAITAAITVGTTATASGANIIMTAEAAAATSMMAEGPRPGPPVAGATPALSIPMPGR